MDQKECYFCIHMISITKSNVTRTEIMWIFPLSKFQQKPEFKE